MTSRWLEIEGLDRQYGRMSLTVGGQTFLVQDGIPATTNGRPVTGANDVMKWYDEFLHSGVPSVRLTLGDDLVVTAADFKDGAP